MSQYTILPNECLDIIETGTKKQAIAAAKKAGKEYQALWFDYRDNDWETALHYTCIEPATEKTPAHPRLTFENFCPDYDTVIREIHRAGRENPIFPATDKGDEALQQVKGAFILANEENFDGRKPVMDLIGSIKQDLAIFVPLLPGPDTTIPMERMSGCDQTSKEWKTFAAKAKNLVIAEGSKYPLEKVLPELAGNASYGGEAGLVVLLDGKDFLKWMKEKDLWKVLRTFGKTKASLAVYDYNNGSGHDVEGNIIDWKKLRRPKQAQPGIVNNFIDSVFGIVGISKIDIPSNFNISGSGTWANIWF